MKRIQSFEFSDLSWWPDIFRRILTDFLQHILKMAKPFSEKIDLLAKAVKSSGSGKIIDLCSGSGGPWLYLEPVLKEKTGKKCEIILTDKFPNLFSEDNRQQNIKYENTPVDATDVPVKLKGTRTLFQSLHHFKPEDAARILQNAVDSRQPIAVYEFLRRRVPDFIILATTFIHVLFLTPFIRPFSITRLLFTYLIPIAPLFIGWDAVVSVLRCYTAKELREMVAKLDKSDTFEWHIDEYQKDNMYPVTYLIGIPKENLK
jgi:hypothetical protein